MATGLDLDVRAPESDRSGAAIAIVDSAPLPVVLATAPGDPPFRQVHRWRLPDTPITRQDRLLI